MQQRVAPISTKASNVTYADGLYWLDGKVNCSTDGSITLGTGLSEKAAYVHAGSYIRLAGVMYKITSKSGTTVMIEEDHATGNNIPAQIALALFVDNRKAEYEATTDKDDITGYYTSIKNTDGDSMIEELGGTETVSSWQGSIVSRNIPDGPIEIHYTAYDKSMNYAVGVVGNEPLDTYKNYTTKEVDELWTMNGTERVSLKTQELDGQYASYVYTYNEENRAYISNNAPRLTGVTVAIDYTGAGQYKTATKTTYYYKTEPRLINNEVQTKPIAVTDSLKISDKIESNGTVTYKGVNTIKGKTWIIPEMVGGNGKLWYTYNIYGSGTNGVKNTEDEKKSSGTNATYFANGSNDFDGYVHKAGGQDYVEAHSTAVIDDNGNITSGFIVHDTSVFTGTGSTGDATVDQPLWFDYTIYDSTEVSSTENSVVATTLASNQKATISIAMAVEVNDNVAPNVVFNDLYWKDKSDNSVYWAEGKAQGHVELRRDLVNVDGTANCELGITYGTDDDKVSGIVKFTGYAWDNKCLSELKWAIVENEDDDDDEETVAYSDPAYKFGEGMQNGATFDTSTGNWTSTATMATNHYTFEVSDAETAGAYQNMNGHKVKWTLTVDTAYIAHEYEEGKFASVAKDLRVIVQATDNASTVHSSAITNAVAASNSTDIATYDKNTSRPTYQIDVVPYITGVETKLSSLKRNNPSVYDRTALGHYPVSDTETVIFSGFNLAGAKYQKKAEKPAEGDNPAVEEVVDDLTGENGNELVASNILASGKIVLKVGDLYTINNMNNNDAKGSYTGTTTSATGDKNVYDNYYNRHPNGDNNNLLTDDVWFDVWHINSNVAQAQGSAYITEPIMKINPISGMLNFAFNSGPANFSMANGTTTSHTTWVGNLARMTTAGFTVDENGVTHGITVGLDTNPSSGSAGRMQYVTSKWGPVYSTRDAAKGTQENYEGTNSSRFETIGAPAGTYNGVTYDDFLFMEDRFASPSIVTSIHKDASNVEHTYVFLAYYDDINGQIRFRYGDLNNTTEHTIGRSFGGFQDAWVYGKGNTGDGNHKSFNTNTRLQDFSVIAASGISGNYLAIDLIKGNSVDNDVIVATWQDSTSDKWYYAYKKKPCTDNDLGATIPQNATSNDGYWSNPILLASNAGEDCHISVDPRGGVHIAAYDSLEANLIYAYFANYNDTTPQIVTVDSYAFTGEHLTIDSALSDDGNYVVPLIGYYMGSAKKPKIAKLEKVISATDGSGTIPSGVDVNDACTGKWETSIIPTESIYSENYAYSHVNVGVWKDSDGKIKKSTRPAANTTNVDTWIGDNKIVSDETNGYFWGNGTDNPVLGYAIKVGTRGYIETAQMK